MGTNCIFFNKSICFRDKSGVRNLLKYYLQFRNMYKANYVLRKYFKLTPIIKISNKINTKGFFKEHYLKNAKYEIDSIKRFLNYSKSKLLLFFYRLLICFSRCPIGFKCFNWFGYVFYCKLAAID